MKWSQLPGSCQPSPTDRNKPIPGVGSRCLSMFCCQNFRRRVLCDKVHCPSDIDVPQYHALDYFLCLCATEAPNYDAPNFHNRPIFQIRWWWWMQLHCNIVVKWCLQRWKQRNGIVWIRRGNVQDILACHHWWLQGRKAINVPIICMFGWTSRTSGDHGTATK